jgi:hypothetical protein
LKSGVFFVICGLSDNVRLPNNRLRLLPQAALKSEKGPSAHDLCEGPSWQSLPTRRELASNSAGLIILAIDDAHKH